MGGQTDLRRSEPYGSTWNGKEPTPSSRLTLLQKVPLRRRCVGTTSSGGCTKRNDQDGQHDERHASPQKVPGIAGRLLPFPSPQAAYRSEEHTSELQSLRHLVCR